MYDNSSKIIEVDINEILPNRFQPRIQFDEEEILELSDSIKEHGVIQPIVVRTIGDKYEIIAGERRYKASVLAGRETVPVIVKNLNDKDSAEVALIENIQRKNLTPIEEALSYKKILDMGYLTQENLASKLGKSQPTVANKIRLLNLSDEVQEALLENKISERHARSLLKLSNSKLQNDMLKRIINERLTVRRTDEEIEKLKNSDTEESDTDSQKIIEKGEIDMNNNMFGITNVPQTSQPTPSNFDIFGTGEQKIEEPQSQIEVTPTEISSASNFNIFEAEPQNTIPSPEAPVMPTMGSTPVVPEVPVMPTMESTPVVPEVSVMPTMESTSVVPEVPQTSPIMESPVLNNPEMIQQSENLFSFGGNTIPSTQTTQLETPSMPEFKMPEPIIVTDYSKQYDPVMPQTLENMSPTVDFKEIINTVRECSKKIEKYGYKIDVEEYDLASIYQVVFKIEK